MNTKKFLFLISIVSASASADVDYSRCNLASGLMLTALNNDGKITLSPGLKISSKQTEGKTEKYIIEGGYPGKTHITLERDDQGRVVRAITGADRLEAKEIETRKKANLQAQVQSALWSGGMGSYSNSPQNQGTEPLYQVQDKNGQPLFRPLTQLTASERKQIGMSDELYREMTQTWKKDKVFLSKIEKGLEAFQSKSKPSYFLGQDSEFEIKDGVCTPKVIRSRFFNTADEKVSTIPIFTKEACEEVAKLHQKHNAALMKCNAVNSEVNTDLIKNYEKISAVYNAYNVYGISGFSWYGGMPGGGYGSNNQESPLSMLQRSCDFMVGKFDFSKMENKTTPGSATRSF